MSTTKNISLEQLNLTAVMSKVDFSNVTPQRMRELFTLKDEEIKDSPFLELSPDQKMFVIAPRKKKFYLMQNVYESDTTAQGGGLMSGGRLKGDLPLVITLGLFLIY